MTELEIMFFVFIGGMLFGIAYTYLIVRHIAKKRGLWEKLNE
jgi:hypothetical protein